MIITFDKVAKVILNFSIVFQIIMLILYFSGISSSLDVGLTFLTLGPCLLARVLIEFNSVE